MIVKRITEESLLVDQEMLFLRNDGLYGTDEQRQIPGLVHGVCKLLMAELTTEEGQYTTQINKTLKEAKIAGGLGICLEL
jgi:hypothetical protein